MQTFPVASCFAVDPTVGAGVLVLLRTCKPLDLTHFKRDFGTLIDPFVNLLNLTTSTNGFVDRFRPITVFRKDCILSEFAYYDDSPAVLAYTKPMFASGPWPRNDTLDAYIPGRVVEEDFNHIIDSQLPTVIDHRTAPLIAKLLFEGSEKLWIPKVGTHQRQVQKIENVIERKTGAKISTEDRREMLQLLSKRDHRACRTCKYKFWPVYDKQVDCDTRCRRAAHCIDCDARYRLPPMMSAYGDAHRWCICGGLAMTPRCLESYHGGLPILAPSPWLSMGWPVPRSMMQ
jgi:hypothetical protein